MATDDKTTPANANQEPAPARLKIARDFYGVWYVSATPTRADWERFDGPTYIRADLYEAALDNAAKRELRLRRQLAKLTKRMEAAHA